MDKDLFLKTLKEGTEDKGLKTQTLQYFIDNYPVQIPETKTIKTPFGEILSIQTGRMTWTSLPDYKVKDDKIAMNKLDENFQNLVNRLDEITNFV